MTPKYQTGNDYSTSDYPCHDYMEARSETINWRYLQKASTTLTEFEEPGRALIEARLGYPPPLNTVLPFEPAIRTLLKAYHEGLTSFEALLKEADEYIKLVRNDDIRRYTTIHYDQDLYDRYNSFLPHLAVKAKERLAKFLGYEPRIEYSAEPEMFIRKTLADDTIYLPETITPYDFQALNIIHYREQLYEVGQEGADKMELIAEHYQIIALDGF